MGNFYNCVITQEDQPIWQVVELHLNFVYTVYAIGLIGSILLTLTLARCFVIRAQPLYTFILLIALCDILYYATYILFHSLLRSLEAYQVPFTEATWVIAKIVAHGIPFAGASARLASEALTTVMAITQYRITKLSLNFKSNAIPSKKNIWITIGITLGISAVLGIAAIPIEQVYRQGEYYYVGTNQDYYTNIYFTILLCLSGIRNLVFPLIVTFCNLKIIMMRREGMRRLRAAGTHVIAQRRQRSSTMCKNVTELGPVALLVSSTALFCVASTPKIASYIKNYLNAQDFVCSWGWQLYYLFADVCIASRFAFNFYLNFAVSRTVRKLLYMRFVCTTVHEGCIVKSSDGSVELTQTVEKMWSNRKINRSAALTNDTVETIA